MNRNLILTGGALFIWGVGEGMFFFFQPLYLQHLGATPVMIGTILGASGLIAAAAMIPAGFLTDRFGPRPLMWSSWGIALTATLIMSLADSLQLFTVGLFLYGLTAFVTAPLNVYVSANRGGWSVGRAITLISALFNFGAMAGPILGGMLGESLGLKSVYSIALGIFVISTIVIFSIKPCAPVPHPHAEPRARLLENHIFVAFLGIAMLTTFATYLPQPMASYFLQNERSLSLASVGQMGFFAGLGNALANLFLGTLNPTVAMLLGQLLVCGFSFLLWQGNHILWYGLGFFFMGGFRLTRSMMMAFARPLVSESEIGLAFGLLETANSIAVIAAPAAAGLLYNLDPYAMFYTSLVMILVMILSSRLLLPRLQKKAAELTHLPVTEVTP